MYSIPATIKKIKTCIHTIQTYIHTYYVTLLFVLSSESSLRIEGFAINSVLEQSCGQQGQFLMEIGISNILLSL